MASSSWQLQTPVSAITFDCDGTLSRIEGIDELAKTNGVHAEVHSLTAEAMGKSGLHPELYQTRLDLVYPNEAQVRALGNHYFEHRVADICAVINVLQRLKKTVYLVSAGLYPAVTQFGKCLKIPRENVYAVDIKFDAQGNYVDFDRASPLICNAGKRQIVTDLKVLHEEIIHIGDGMNDLVTVDLVTRFIGYGGVYYRENIAAKSDYYIVTESMAPLLPLVLTQSECEMLLPEERELYDKGLADILAGNVRI